jgi:hypothetical protein
MHVYKSVSEEVELVGGIVVKVGWWMVAWGRRVIGVWVCGVVSCKGGGYFVTEVEEVFDVVDSSGIQ